MYSNYDKNLHGVKNISLKAKAYYFKYLALQFEDHLMAPHSCHSTWLDDECINWTLKPTKSGGLELNSSKESMQSDISCEAG
jgi:hypothetical protein